MSLETISQCAFGIQTGSFRNPNNELAKQGAAAFESFRSTGLATDIFFALFFHFPAITSIIPFIPEAYDKIGVIAKDTLKARKSSGVIKKDFLQRIQELIDEIESGNTKDPEVKRLLNEKILLAQCVIFFVAGKIIRST